jgi:uncharacterized protein with HEPN domain
MKPSLIHDYCEVDQVLVWATATREIPALLAKLDALCKDDDSSNDS